jgi:hypothetical protein
LMIREFMLERVRAWYVEMHVRLMTIKMLSTSLPGKCERRAFASGVYFYKMRWRMPLRLVSVHCLHSPVCIL